MSQKYTAEEVRAEADFLSTYSRKTSQMLTAYADSIERAQAGVTGEVVERAYAAMDATFRREYPAQLDEAEKALALDGVRAALLAVWPSVPAQAAQAGVQDATEVHAYLPPGYRMATRDGDYWPLFGDAYCTNHAFPTRELAALEAWKQAHKKLNDSMDSIRRFAATPSAHEGESA